MSAEVTISEILRLNLDRAEASNASSSLASFRSHARLFTELWGKMEAKTLTKSVVLEWVARVRTERGLKPSSIRHKVGFLSKAYNHAIELGLVELNPAARLKLKRGAKRHQWLNYQQEGQMRASYLLHFGSVIGEFYWSAERFALLTGCRLGEQAYLRAEHLFPPGPDGEPGVLVIPDEGKTGTRDVPLNVEAWEIAQKWLIFSRSLGSEYVFWPVAGDRYKVAQAWVRDVWTVCRKLAALTWFQRRDLRRTFGSRLIQAGDSIFFVMQHLGHSTPLQTMTYCQVDLLKRSMGVKNLR